VRTRAGQRLAASLETWDPGGHWLVAYRTKREVTAGRTIDIPDLVPKSGDDTAPARSDEDKFLSPIPKVNQLVIRSPGKWEMGEMGGNGVSVNYISYF
jgi:hypothetical protein